MNAAERQPVLATGNGANPKETSGSEMKVRIEGIRIDS
jgi:hypothetical protein